MENNSWGYRSDGEFYYQGHHKENGPEFTSGDTIGCYLNFRQNLVFYTKNGINLGNYYFNTNVS